MLSLSPRFDLFRFEIPKDYIPEEVRTKYDDIMSRRAGVITSCIDYLNESIQGVTIPGLDNLIHEQPQVSHRKVHTDSSIGLGKINIEPAHINTTYGESNPLSSIQHEFKVTFRQNQGLYNYLIIYETILKRYVKSELYETSSEEFNLLLLDDSCIPTLNIRMFQPKIMSIDGLEFSYSKIDREFDTFDVTFVYNNIDFDFDLPR